MVNRILRDLYVFVVIILNWMNGVILEKNLISWALLKRLDHEYVQINAGTIFDTIVPNKVRAAFRFQVTTIAAALSSSKHLIFQISATPGSWISSPITLSAFVD